MNTPSLSAQSIIHEADRCVLCGACLPHCPTFRRTGREAESPRGRISLAQALARGQLVADETLTRHIDACLGCRACEAACPSEVRYGNILGHVRRLLVEEHGLKLTTRLTTGLVSDARFMKAAVRTGNFPWAHLADTLSPGMGNLVSLAQARKPTRFRDAGASAGARGRVALFLGCTGEAADGEALNAAAYVLRQLGFAVTVPRGQGCCGAMHHSKGDRAGFELRARRNLQAFELEGVDAIVSVASGCSAMLSEYGQWLEAPEAAQFSGKIKEITEFVAGLDWSAKPPLPLDAKLAVHIPCTQNNVLHHPRAAADVLAHIPALQVFTLPDNQSCCGAAGLHMLEQPEAAQALRDPKLDALTASGAQYLATTNVGCALHLAAGAKARGLAVEVLHPITLLARQLAAASNSL